MLTDELNKVLKYSNAETVRNMLSQIESDPEHQKPNSALRGVAADALDDFAGNTDDHQQRSELESQARLLRSGENVYVRNDKVYHAKGGDQRNPTNSAYMTPLQRFQNGHKEAALASVKEVDPKTEKQLDSDAEHFFHSNYHLFDNTLHNDYGRFGADFWLSRNGRNSGYADSPEMYGSQQSKQLHDAATQAGSGQNKWGQPAGLSE